MESMKRVTLKNGRVVYRIVISLGYDSQGHKLVKNLSYSVNQSSTAREQEREALKYAMDLEDRLKYGREPAGANLLFNDFARKWLEGERENLAAGTYVGYEQLLRSKILPYFKTYRIAHVRTSDIEAFYKMLCREYSPGTIKRYANVLNRIFGTARRWELITENPCQGARKPKKLQEGSQLRYFTPQQALVFLKSLDMSYGRNSRKNLQEGFRCREQEAGEYFGDRRVPIQYRVFFSLSLFCGFRKGETLALCWEDIDFEEREISVSKAIGRTGHGFGYKEPKNRASMRKVPFPESLIPLLTEYRDQYNQWKREPGRDWQGSGNLFVRRDGTLMGQSTAYQYFVSHLKRYNRWVKECPEEAAEKGLTVLPEIPLHGLRHSCATLLNYLEVNIVDISKYLGHASCSTTMNIYTHSFEEQKRAASDRLNEFLCGAIEKGQGI